MLNAYTLVPGWSVLSQSEETRVDGLKMQPFHAAIGKKYTNAQSQELSRFGNFKAYTGSFSRLRG
jgi:hypothetical protein